MSKLVPRVTVKRNLRRRRPVFVFVMRIATCKNHPSAAIHIGGDLKQFDRCVARIIGCNIFNQTWRIASVGLLAGGTAAENETNN